MEKQEKYDMERLVDLAALGNRDALEELLGDVQDMVFNLSLRRHNERKVHNDMDGGIPGSQAAGHGANRKIYSKSLLAAAFGLAGGHISYIPQD